MELSQRHLTTRVAASILFAVFAYLGLLFGGNLIISPSASTNTLSSSGKDPQITARDAVRGMIAADRKIAPKQSVHDTGPAAVAISPLPEFASWASPSATAVFAGLSGTAAARAHQPRAPPLLA